MPSRRCGDRSSSIVQFSASVIVSALVFDHSREATQCLQHTTQPHLPSLARNHMCEVVLWHCHLSAGLLCAVCFLMSFHFTISQATDSILWLKSVIFMWMVYLTEASSYQTSDTACNTSERNIFKTSQNWDHNEKAKAIDGPGLYFLLKRS